MKKNFLIGILLIVLFFGAALCAAFYPRSGSLSSEAKAEENFDIKKTDYAGIMEHVSQKKLETFSEEIIRVISRNETEVASDEFLYAKALTERFVKENPDAAIASLKEDPFMRARSSVKQQYVAGIFSALAKFYPERFPAYFIELANDSAYLSPKGFLPFRDVALTTFFTILSVESPDVAARMLTDGSIMDGLKGIQSVGSDLSFMGISIKLPPVPYTKTLSELRKAVALKQAQNDPLLFLSELEKIKDTNERNTLMLGMAQRLQGEDPNKTLEWVRENMNEKDREEFIRRLFQAESWGNDSNWQNAWVYANEIGLDKLNEWELKGLFAKAGKDNPEMAIDVIEKNLKGETREQMLAAVLSGLIETKSSSEMLAIVDGLEDGLCRNETVPVFFDKYYKEHPEEALTWALKQNDSDFLGRAVSTKVNEDSNAAKAMANKVLASENVSDRVASDIARSFVDVPDAGIEMIAGLEGEKRDAFMKDFYRSWAGRDAVKALDSLPGGGFSETESIAMKQQIIRDSASVYPAKQMVEVAKKLNDPETTQYMATRFVWTFSENQNYGGEKDIIGDTLKRKDVPDDLKQAISNALEAKNNGAEKPADISSPHYDFTSRDWM